MRRVILSEHRGKQLRSGIGFFVNQYSHGHIQKLRVGFKGLCFTFLVAVADQGPLRQQIIQNLHKFLLIAAGIETHIQNQLRRPLADQVFDHRQGFLGAAGDKVLNTHIADGSVQEIALGNHGIDPIAGHIQRHHCFLTPQGDGHLCSDFAPDPVR